MSRVLVTEQHLSDIAYAIRSKLEGSDTYRPGEMAAAIREIETGYPEPTGSVSITQNGTVNVKDYASAEVNVQPNLQGKTATQNGTVTPDSGYDGLSRVVVNVEGAGAIETGISVENGALVYDGAMIDVKTQPVISNDEIAATASQGMSFSMKQTVRIRFEFDYTMTGTGGIAFSFGGSNTNSGVIVIRDTYFQFFANGSRFQRTVSISTGVRHHCVVDLTPSSLELSVDGALAASGTSEYCQNACMYIMKGGTVALMYNQSAHSEYVAGTIDNLTIRMSMV